MQTTIRDGFEPGALARLVTDATERARQAGAIRSIATECDRIEDGGLSFIVRVVANLALKDAERLRAVEQRPRGADARNPFLPYEPEMFVADVPPRHVCLLNKYNVVDRHLLIVTREFESQDALLTRDDFVALWSCLGEIDGLGFYNGGAAAGASQPHRHLQLVSFPLAPGTTGLPVEPALAAARFEGGLGTAPVLPFRHSVARVVDSPEEAAGSTHRAYLRMLDVTGAADGPYNLLITRRWLLLVPRSRGAWRGVPVNSLGFAGSLLVRDVAQRAIVERLGPLNLLRRVARD